MQCDAQYVLHFDQLEQFQRHLLQKLTAEPLERSQNQISCPFQQSVVEWKSGFQTHAISCVQDSKQEVNLSLPPSKQLLSLQRATERLPPLLLPPRVSTQLSELREILRSSAIEGQGCVRRGRQATKTNRSAEEEEDCDRFLQRTAGEPAERYLKKFFEDDIYCHRAQELDGGDSRQQLSIMEITQCLQEAEERALPLARELDAYFATLGVESRERVAVMAFSLGI